MKNQTILITGGTTGIGLATAQLLQAQGARVLVTGRNPETLAAARATLGAEAVVFASDSASLADAQGLGAAVQKHTAKLDGVFLNAGIGQFGPIEAMTPKHFDDMFGVNVRGVYFQLQSLLPLLANPSSVVLNASVVAQLGLPATSIYSATKAAVVSLGKIPRSRARPTRRSSEHDQPRSDHDADLRQARFPGRRTEGLRRFDGRAVAAQALRHRRRGRKARPVPPLERLELHHRRRTPHRRRRASDLSPPRPMITTVVVLTALCLLVATDDNDRT